MQTDGPHIHPIEAEFYGIHVPDDSQQGSSGMGASNAPPRAPHTEGDVPVPVLSAPGRNRYRLQEIEYLLGAPVHLVDSTEDHIRELQRGHYGVGASSIAGSQEPLAPQHASSAPASPGTRPSLRLTEEPSPVAFVERLIGEARSRRATDIHLEPQRNRAEVRFRVDGVLHQVKTPEETTGLYPAVVSRLKILSHLDIAEQRLPQDGRFSFVLSDGEEMDVRVSTLPTPFGEAVDLRLLSTAQVYRDLASLGLSLEHQDVLDDVLRRPHGVVLVTGPTGSGKTTTLYAFLCQLNETDRKIITIEDPIEYQIPGVTQVQIHPKIDLTFARGLRSMLRHDPDIMMVGEIRDFETADTTIQVALTGHLVFSTVHTNDVPTTPARLINMGVEPYLVASSLECVIAQRLIRLVCEGCRRTVDAKTDPIHAKAAQLLATPGLDWDGKISVGTGCDRCLMTGYSGRTGIYEILRITEAMQGAILERAPASEIRLRAEREGFRSMRWDGLRKAAAGRTTVEEVLRVTRKEVY